MKRWILLFCCTLSLLTVTNGATATVPTPKETLETLSATLKKTEYVFTPEVRQAYFNYAEAVIREKYGPTKINDATWKWIKQRPQILSAVIAGDYPLNPNILLNFQRLCLALGPVRADQWRQLLLAYAIRYRHELFPIDRGREEWNPARLEKLITQKKGMGGGFVFQDEENLPPATDEEKRLGKWLAGPQSLTLTRPKMTIPDLLDLPLHEINIITRKKPDEPPMVTKFPNWTNVALWGELFPIYTDCTPTPQRAVLMKIFRNGRIPPKSDRPAFNMAKADWPILLYLADLDEIDETSFIFNYFVTNRQVAPLGLGEKAASNGSSEITEDDPAFQYAKSNWNPKKFIRVYNGKKKDQGGKSWAWGMNAVNVPATSVGAPPNGKFYYTGERGNYSYFMSCADNAFTGTGSSATWLLRKVESVDPSRPLSGSIQHIYFLGLAATLNQGVQAYEDAHMILNLIDLLSLSKMARTALLESAFRQNPLDGDILYRLAAEYRSQGDAKSTIKMLNAARSYAATGLKRPVSVSGCKSARNAIAKILKDPEPSFQGVPVISVNLSPWFFLTCSDITLKFLRDTGSADKALFRDELDYEQKAASGCGDKPIVRAIESLQELVQ
ncbi:MAG: hypothetical protein RR007_04760 [Kiritimatiellia bacterium]